VVFQPAVGAGFALLAVVFPLPVRAGVARRAVAFHLPVRAGGAVRAVAFHLPVRAGCTPRRTFSASREDTGCTPRSGLPVSRASIAFVLPASFVLDRLRAPRCAAEERRRFKVLGKVKSSDFFFPSEKSWKSFLEVFMVFISCAHTRAPCPPLTCSPAQASLPAWSAGASRPCGP